MTRISQMLHRHVFKPRLKTSANVEGLDVLDRDSLVNLMNAGRPMELLQKSIGGHILVELKGQRKLKGKLRGFDQHLNLIIEDADEIYYNSETEREEVESVKTIIVRGDNVVIVSPPPKPPKKKKE